MRVIAVFGIRYVEVARHAMIFAVRQLRNRANAGVGIHRNAAEEEDEREPPGCAGTKQLKLHPNP